jgi:uncharacterized membrane protein YdjX (TVP38/TMEM64 family)
METPGQTVPRRRAGRWRPLLLIGAIMTVMLLARSLGVGDRLASLREWIESLGSWGPLAFLGLYVVAVVAALPGAVITVAAGALFGALTGTLLVSVGSTVGAALAFLIARYFAREAVVSWLGKSDRFRKLDRLTEQHGAVMVALTRLVPIFPFNLINYGFGLTRVPFWTYVLWSWLCMLPATILYVVGADAATTAVAEGRVPWPLVLAALAVLVILALLVRYARARLEARPRPQPAAPADAGSGS